MNEPSSIVLTEEEKELMALVRASGFSVMGVVAIGEERKLWATIRAAHEKALDKVLKNGFCCEERPGEDRPLAVRIDHLSFSMFCEGFFKGMEVNKSPNLIILHDELGEVSFMLKKALLTAEELVTDGVFADAASTGVSEWDYSKDRIYKKIDIAHDYIYRATEAIKDLREKTVKTA